jgi:hypothetical protein
LQQATESLCIDDGDYNGNDNDDLQQRNSCHPPTLISRDPSSPNLSCSLSSSRLRSELDTWSSPRICVPHKANGNLYTAQPAPLQSMCWPWVAVKA